MQARFTSMCNVIADTSAIAHSLHPLEGPGGEDYYRLDFNVVLLFGLTELKAQISWIDGVRPVLVSRLLPCADHPHDVPGRGEEVQSEQQNLNNIFLLTLEHQQESRLDCV